MTRSHSNSKSHARARPKSLPNEASVVMMRRVRVGFLYVTLRLNAAAFSKSVRFLFSLVLFFVLIYLYSLHLSSRPRTFLIGAPAQESISKVHFCASFALGRPRERKKSLVLIVLAVKHTKSSQDSFSSFLSFFLRFASSIGGTNLEPISGTFSTIGTFSQTKCISFFPYLDTESKRNGRRDSSGTQHPPIHITVIVLRTLRRVFFFGFAGFCATGKFLFSAGKIQISSSERELFVVCYNEREHA